MPKDNNKQDKIFKKTKGEVVSNKMEKTLVVKVTNLKTHAKYRKKYQSSKRYKVHYEKGDYQVGDIVEFVECKPLSKDKKWRIAEDKKAEKKMVKKQEKETKKDDKKDGKNDKKNLKK